MEKKLDPRVKYDANNTKKITFKFNLNTDADILDFLEASGNKLGTIKKALRELMARE